MRKLHAKPRPAILNRYGIFFVYLPRAVDLAMAGEGVPCLFQNTVFPGYPAETGYGTYEEH